MQAHPNFTKSVISTHKYFLIMEEVRKRNTGGRPVKTDKLSQRVRLRLSEIEMAESSKNARLANLSLPEYIRMILLRGKVTNLFSEEEQLAKLQLIGIANNLNQLVKEAHTYGLVSVENEARKNLSDIRAILDKYKLKKHES